MSVSPYQLVETQSSILDTFIKQSARIRSKQDTAKVHKGEMAIDFNKKAKDIYDKASKAGRKRKRSGLSRFVNAVIPIIVAIFNPIAGGILAGASAGNKQYQQGKFTEAQANAVKQFMIEMGLGEEYGNTFLRENVAKLDTVKEGMSELAYAARKMKSPEKVIGTAAIAGVGTYFAGKAANNALIAKTPGASTMYTGATGGSVAVNAAGTGPAIFPAMARAMRTFAPFQGVDFTTFLQKGMQMVKDANGQLVPAFPEYAKALQSMMWAYQSMAQNYNN